MDIVETKRMNPSVEHNGTNYQYGWNVGRWPASEMWTYANGAFFNNLPEDLRNVIINTKVISGHGKSDKSNFPSTDKIYLLSTHEVWEDVTSNNRLKTYDTAYNNTRQLDYYRSKGITTSNYSGAKKTSPGSSSGSYWWLRAAHSNNDIGFWGVDSSGRGDNAGAYTTIGFAPAFRIG